MNPTLKRILLIAALLIVAALIGYGIYYLYKKTAAGGPVTPVTGVPGAPGQLPVAGEQSPPTGGAPGGVAIGLPPGGVAPTEVAPPAPNYYVPEAVTQISTDNANFTSVMGGAARYYNLSDGKFYKVQADGNIKTLSEQLFYNVQKVTWANTANKAVLEYPDSSKIIYNFDTQKQVSLPKHWQEFSWSPDSNELAAKSLGLAPENRWLIVTKDDGTGTQLIEPMGNNAGKVKIDWSPSRQTVALSQTGAPQGADRREVLFVGLNGENFKSTIVEGLDFDSKWSPTGQHLLYNVDSARSNFKPELWIVDSYGDNIGANRRLLNLNTWANKCAFGDENTLYCAIPRNLPQGAGMAPEVAASSLDDLYKIDLKTGLKTNVPTGQDYHINSPAYDSAHNKIIFTDPRQNGVFAINL